MFEEIKTNLPAEVLYCMGLRLCYIKITQTVAHLTTSFDLSASSEKAAMMRVMVQPVTYRTFRTLLHICSQKQSFQTRSVTDHLVFSLIYRISDETSQNTLSLFR